VAFLLLILTTTENQQASSIFEGETDMVDRTHSGKRCRTLQHLTTRDGILRRDTCGTIRYEMDNLDRRLVFVEWENGMSTPVFAHEIELCEVRLAA
jgi:hypothetical protein